MKLIRWVLGGVILFLDRVFAPRSLVRTPEAQGQVDAAALQLKLYQYNACPFCVKVRRAMKRLGLPIETRDAKSEPYRSELLSEGGQIKVPCLRIESQKGVEWMYESSDIVTYLQKTFSA